MLKFQLKLRSKIGDVKGVIFWSIFIAFAPVVEEISSIV